ncbi:MAG: hypothetical protein ABSE77_07175 [Acidimicrobiales bacterium]|jgi:hypothetical protein
MPSSSQASNAGVLSALKNVVSQSRELSSQIQLVHCETQEGRSGQQLAVRALLLGEQAGGYFRSGLSTSDPAEIKSDLAQAVTLSEAAQSAAAHAIKLLSHPQL